MMKMTLNADQLNALLTEGTVEVPAWYDLPDVDEQSGEPVRITLEEGLEDVARDQG